MMVEMFQFNNHFQNQMKNKMMFKIGMKQYLNQKIYYKQLMFLIIIRDKQMLVKIFKITRLNQIFNWNQKETIIHLMEILIELYI